MSEHAGGSRAQHQSGSSGAGTTAPIGAVPTSLLTDHYELTMVAAGAAPTAPPTAAASSRCSPAGCPTGRRYGVVAGTGRLLEAIGGFRFGEAELELR